VVGGRFFAFDIARALQARGCLAAIVSAYPRALRERIALNHLRWNPLLAVRERLALRDGRRSRQKTEFDYAVKFGKWASRHLPRAGVVQAWTGYALEPLAVAKETGAVAVAFRASAHIATQDSLLREEFEMFGLRTEPIYEPMIERELREYASADYIQVISSFARRSFLEQGFPAERLIFAHVGVDIAEVAGIPRVKRSGPLRVLYLGHVSLRKGVHYLLQAAHSLPAGTVDVSLVGGASPDGKLLMERYARPGEWKGPVGRDRLASVFAEHDVLVLPSIEDGFGAVISEAMAAGLPVIATTNTGGPDTVDEGVTGYIVPPRSSDALASALIKLADDPVRCVEMGRAAAAAMRARRTWADFADEMLTAYARPRAAGRES
jgi:glycosyltransferase involved in cell wall biosynthesis